MYGTRVSDASIAFDSCAGCELSRNNVSSSTAKHFDGSEPSDGTTVARQKSANVDATSQRCRFRRARAMGKFFGRVHLVGRAANACTARGKGRPASRESGAIFPSVLVVSSTRYRNSILFGGATCTTRVIRFRAAARVRTTERRAHLGD